MSENFKTADRLETCRAWQRG